MRQGLPNQHRDSEVINHVATVVDDAVLAMSRVRVQRHVGYDRQLRQFVLDRANRALHEPVRVCALGPVERLVLRVNHGKQGDGRYAEPVGFCKLWKQAVDALARNAGHRLHRFTAALTVQHEYRVDEIGAGKRGFGDQAAKSGCPATAPKAEFRELSGERCTHS